MRMTKIVATLGPATDSLSMIKRLIKAGMNVARLNLSHGSFKQQEERINLVKEARKELGVPVAILLDTRGPEVRIDKFEKSPIYLNEGDQFTLTTDEILGNQKKVSITYKLLPNVVEEGSIILANDGLIEFEVISVTKKDIVCVVKAGGELSDRKSLNLPDVKINMPYVSPYDKEGFLFGIAQEADYFALSFVRDVDDVLEVRELLDKNGGEKIQLISKIENREGVDNFAKIIKVCDGAMVARGDLGVEIPFEEIPKIQKDMIKTCVSEGKKVITATQMLESMIHSKRPTRAEISDVANAIYDGTSAIMLSGETAAGKYPIEAVKTMDKIALETEANIDYKKQFSGVDPVINNVADAV
ncbi:MAG: pyruvate kinase, partial [Firmicutes bacterium]|nr:pyruvate kinase [Bacillota bacterium]